MEWKETEDGPDCTCGNPTVVKLTMKRDGSESAILLCLFHTAEEGMATELPAVRPADWYERIAQNKPE